MIAYVTDLEGMWSRFASFATDNPLLSLAGDELVLAPGTTFVFGGDAIDRGPGGRRLVRVLLAAKRRYADRVVLIAGNRDINKLRLARELTGHPPEGAPAGSRPELLRWIFENTMGSRAAFAFRREELAADGAPATDEDVVDSYLADLGPGGDLREYLRVCQLTYRAGATLFVHGGLPEASVGHVPTAAAPAGDVDRWAEELNRWYAAQLDAFTAGAMEDGEPAWRHLVAYQAPIPGTRVHPASVVYGRTADDDNNPLLPSPRVVDRLRHAGIRRLVVGHTPNGDTPSLLRDGDFEMLVADNSYSRLPDGSKVGITDDAVTVEGRTRLDDGRELPVRFRLEVGAASPIGARLADTGQLIRGALPGGEWLVYRGLPGHRIEQLGVTLAGRPLRVPR